MTTVSIVLLVLLLVFSFLGDAICNRWIRIPLVILVVVISLFVFGNPFKTLRARAVGTCVSKGVNDDGSYSVHVRLENADKPLFYREWWGTIMGGTIVEGRRKKGKMTVAETNCPPENRWEFLISTDKTFVPVECGLCLEVLSKPQPLEFDENGNCLHPPESGVPARTVVRKPDGTVVFTIGPEAFDLHAERFDPPLPRSLSVYFNGASLGTITKIAGEEEPDGSTAARRARWARRKNPHAESAEPEPHAESAEPGGGSGEAQPPPVESHAESAERAE